MQLLLPASLCTPPAALVRGQTKCVVGKQPMMPAAHCAQYQAITRPAFVGRSLELVLQRRTRNK